jgi:hypothetical protein
MDPHRFPRHHHVRKILYNINFNSVCVADAAFSHGGSVIIHPYLFACT